MDPLSITSGIITIASLAGVVGRAFSELRTECKTLPGRLHALSNEVADIELVLYQVASVVEQRAGDSNFPQANIPYLLRQAQIKLDELRNIVLKITEISKSTKVPILQVHAWRKDQPRLQVLQEDIKTIKCSLNIMLGASHSQDMMRIRVDLENISSVSSQSAQLQTVMQDEIKTSLVSHHDDFTKSLSSVYQQVDQRIGNVEAMLEAQSMQFQANQFNQIGNSYGQAPYHTQRLPQRSSKQSQYPKPPSGECVGVRVTQNTGCRQGCCCACHKKSSSTTSSLVDRVLGQMFVGYAGLPLLSPKCDTDSCKKSQAAHVSVEYWFPLGFVWSQIFRLQLTYHPNIGPQLELSTLRRVPDSAQCVNFALNGNIEGLKDLFKRGIASPRDVSNTRGYSVLRWAMYGKQYQTCRFLLNAGADPDYRPIAASDNSPRNKAHQFLLMGGLSNEDVEALRCLTQGSDFIEDQNYTVIHRIVLGLSMLDLEEQICVDPKAINTTDAMGRTPLAWAACRGDERIIVALLSHGAKVNTLDVQHASVVSHAADRNYATCVRLLLEAGADPDLAAAFGHRVGNPLNVAARNASDPLVLKTLLDFGANVDSSGVDGMTALIHASRRDLVAFATLLLEYGANINATSAAGQTPLSTAVAYNSHNVLQLLLDRWFEYSECPRLKGPNLLQIVAIYADVDTMAILTATDHLHLKYDQDYVLGDFISRLNARPDATEKLIAAFDELLSVIKQGPASPHQGTESLMESGLLGVDESNSDCSDDVFETALESLKIGTESGEKIGCPILSPKRSRTF